MSDNWRQARRGKYWDKGENITTSRGEYILPEDDSVDFAHPLMEDGTGYASTIFNKRKVKSYPSDLAAGSGQIVGYSFKVYEDVSTYSTDELVNQGRKYKARDIEIMLMGAIQAVNQGDSDVSIGDTIIPVDEGFEKMTDSNQYSAGKALENIPSGEKGLIWVNPDYEKAII